MHYRTGLLLLIMFIVGNPIHRGFAAQPLPNEALPIRKITIEGIEGSGLELLRSELLSREGEMFSPGKLESDRRHLNRIGIFRNVTIQATVVEEGVDLHIEVEPRARYLPLIAMGGSDDNGFSAGGGIQSNDFLGSGLHFFGRARAGGETRAEIRLGTPWLRSEFLSYAFSFDGADRSNDLDRFEEGSIDTEFRLGRRLSENFRGGVLAGWFFLDSDRPEITLAEGRRDHIPRLGLYLDYDNRDQLSLPRRGWNNELLLSRQGFFGIGESDYWELTLDVRRYHPLGEKQTIFLSALSRIRTGTVGTEIPWHQDFHLGGTNTVRGWNRNSQYGKNEFISTVEYRYRLVEPKKILKGRFGDKLYLGLELALFTDIGKAWGRFSDSRGHELLAGGGIGIRILMPFVNVIRFDFALGESGEGVFTHFGVVPKVEKRRQRIR